MKRFLYTRPKPGGLLSRAGLLAALVAVSVGSVIDPGTTAAAGLNDKLQHVRSMHCAPPVVTVASAAASRCVLEWRLHGATKIRELVAKIHVTKIHQKSTALAEKGLLRGFRLRSLSQRAALRTNLFVSPRKSVSSIQTKRLHREGPDASLLSTRQRSQLAPARQGAPRAVR